MQANFAKASLNRPIVKEDADEDPEQQEPLSITRNKQPSLLF